ncbi:MAG: S8 family serine peptidase [Fibrobacterales bacterium]
MIKTPNLWAKVLSVPLFLSINSIAVTTFSPADLHYSLIPTDQTEVQTSVLTNGSGAPIIYSVRSTSIVSRPTVSSTISNFSQSAPVSQSMLTHQAQNSTNFVPGQVVVAIQEESGVSSFSSLSAYPAAFQNLQIDHIKTIIPPQPKSQGISLLSSTQKKILVLTLSEETTEAVSAAVESLNNDPEVLYAEPNWIISLQGIPDDTEFHRQWGLHNTGQDGGIIDSDIDMPRAWDVTTGSSTTTVAIIDSGIDYDHPDLIDNLWTNPNEIADNGIDDDNNGYIDDIHGWNFIDDTNDARDNNNHGSNVAGIIAAKGGNNQGVAGVAWNAQLVSLKFLDGAGNGTSVGALQSIYYAVAANIPLINNSWGGSSYSQMLKDAIDESDALFLCAAGNTGTNADVNPIYPAAYTSDNVISVGSSTRLDWIADHSNYGVVSVDLMAPGESIYTTSRAFAYQTSHGTSMATPFVSGVAALAYSLNPSLTAVQIKNLILDNADPIGYFFGKSVTGGRLNALNVVTKATPSWFSVTDNGNGTIAAGGSVEFSVSVDPSTLTAGTWEVEIEIETNDPASPIVILPVTIEIGSCGSLTAVPSTLTFPLTWVGNTENQSIELLNNCNADVTINSITSTLSEVIPNLAAPLTVPAFGSLTLPATFSPISEGIQNGELVIESQATPSTFIIDVQTEAANGPILTFSSPTIEENLIEGESRILPFTVTNTGVEPLEFTLIASAQWITVPTALFTVAPGASTIVDITLDAGTLIGGNHSSDIEFLHNGVGASPKPLPTTITIEADNFAYASPSPVNFGDVSGPVDETFTPQLSVGNLSHSGAYAVGDLDLDGELDYILGEMVNAAPVTSNLVWLNNARVCDAPFNYEMIAQGAVAAQQYEAIAMGDIDGDGDIDLVASVSIAGTNPEIFWYENNGSQSFIQHTLSVPVLASNITIMDFDTDGSNDIVITDKTNNTAQLLRNNGNETFTASSLITVVDATIQTLKHLDINGDGRMDFAGIVFNTNTNEYDFVSYLNIGNPTFLFTTHESFDSKPTISVGYINADNDPDVVLTGSFDHIKWYESLAGTFNPFTAPHAGLTGEVVIADINNDGNTDIVSVVNDDVTGPTLSVLYKSGFTFSAPVPLYGGTLSHMTVGDFNSDLDNDIVGYDSDNNQMIELQSNRSITRVVTLENTGGFETEVIDLGIDDPFKFNIAGEHHDFILPARTKLCFDIAYEGNNEYVTGEVRFISNALNGSVQSAALIAGIPPYEDVAPGKRIQADTEEGIHWSDRAFDKDPTTRWSSEFEDPQNIWVELLGSYDVDKIKFHWEAASAKTYAIEVTYAGGNGNWVVAKQIYNADGGWDIHNVDLRGITGVRMAGTERNTEYGYSLWSFEVWGRQNISNTPALTTIDLTPETMTIRANETAQFTAQGLDQNGNTFTTPITWSVSGPATITQNGLVSPTARGFYIVTASSGPITKTAQLIVSEAPALDRIEVSPVNDLIMEGETLQYTATGYDQFNNTVTIDPTWSTDGGAISATGLYMGSAPGTFNVTATVNAITATTAITVQDAPHVDIINITPLNATIMEGATIQYNATGVDQYGDAITVNPVWSTDGGAISATGLYTGSAPGVFVVTATESGVITTTSITINDAPRVDVINIEPLNATIMEGATLQYSATGIDQYGDAITVSPVWSTDGGAISAAGLYTGSAPGVFVVTATESGVIATTSITINDAPRVDVINIEPLDATIMEGQTLQYSATGIDQYGDAITINPAWTTNGGSFSATGLYTGSAPGAFTVTASENGTTAATTITVNGAPRLDRIEVSPANSTLVEGSTQQYSVVGFDQYNNTIVVLNPTWTVDGGSIAPTGLYTASAVGSFSVTATLGTISGSTGVTVSDAPTLDRIEISPENATIVEGNTLQYSAIGYDQFGDVIAFTPAWSTDGGSISATGRYTGSEDGTFTVTVGYNGVSQSTSIIVTAAPTLASIAINPTSATVTVGTTRQYAATGTDQYGNSIAIPSLVWDVLGSAGTINQSGRFTATSASNASRITATSGSVTAFVPVITIALPSDVALNKPAKSSTNQSGYYASSANDGNDNTRWSSLFLNNQYLEINLQGFYNITTSKIKWETAAARTYRIDVSEDGQNWKTAYSTSYGNGGTDTHNLNEEKVAYIRMYGVTRTTEWGMSIYTFEVMGTPYVNDPPVLTSIVVSPLASSIKVGETQQYAANAYDQYGDLYLTSFDWTTTAGSIDNAGLLTAATEGAATVTATAEGISRNVAVTVLAAPELASIVMTPASLTIDQYETAQFSAEAFDQYGEPVSALFNWSSTLGSIDNAGSFTSTLPGTGIITVTAEGVSVAANVTVIELPVLASAEITPNTASIDFEGTIQVSAQGYDQFGNPIAANFTWHATIGTISLDGIYFGATAGVATLTATSGSVVATASITVADAPVLTTAVVSPNGVSLPFGASELFSVEGLDQYGNAIAASFTWSSDIGTITPTGLFTGTAEGLTTITATSGSVYASVTATVAAQPVLTSVIITPGSATIPFGGTAQFTAQGFDQFANSIAAVFTWSADIGSISTDGLYSGSVEGSATITATAGAIAADAQVIVAGQPMLSTIVITPDAATIAFGSTQQFSAEGYDQFNNAFPATFAWNADIGTITAAGLYTGSVEGAATITVASGAVSATASVSVSEEPVLSIAVITPNTVTLAFGEEIQFDVEGFDQDGNPIAAIYTWATTKGSIDNSGYFTASEEGVATITATAGSVVAFATATVSEEPVVTTIALTPTSANLSVGQDLQFNAVAFDQFNDPIATLFTWNVAGSTGSISTTGHFTALNASTGTLVTVTAGSITETAMVVIYNNPILTTIELTPAVKTLDIGNSQQYTAVGRDQFGDVISVPFTWSTIGSGGSINTSGRFTATTASQNTQVVVTSGSVTAQALVRVNATPVDVALNKTATARSTESGHPARYANDGNSSSRWSSTFADPQWIEIDLNGEYDLSRVVLKWETAAAASYQILVSSDKSTWKTAYSTTNGNGGTDNFTISEENVRYVRMQGTKRTTEWGYSLYNFEVYGIPHISEPPYLVAMDLTPKNASIVAGESQQFVATGLDQYGDNYTVTPAWSVNGSATIVDGLLSTTDAGTYTITAVEGTVTTTTTITATEAPRLVEIAVTPQNQEIMAGESQQFSVSGIDQYGNTFSVNPTWSVDNGAITVNGLFTSSTAGVITVVAVDGAISGTASITVLATPELHTIIVTPASSTIRVGESIQHITAGLDQYGNDFNVIPAWSTSAGATVVNGLFIPTLPGTYEVTATDGSVSGSVTIEVLAAPALHTIIITPATSTIKVGESQQFITAGLDQYGNDFNVYPIWSTSTGASVVNGLFIPTTPGSFIVTATDGSVTEEAVVTVTAAPALFEIIITPQNSFINTDESQQFSATGRDQYGDAYPVVPFWDTDANASITATGLFTSDVPAAYVVRATDGGITSTTHITVVELPRVAVVTVDEKEVEQGQSVTLTYSAIDQFGAPITPSTVLYSVNGGGTISGSTFTGTAAGTWDITITADGVSGSNTVTVTNLPSMVRNGDFSSGKTYWSLSLYGGYASWYISNGRSYFDISNGGSADWNIQLQQQGFNLKQGKSYIFKFDAKATGTRTISAQVEKSSSPWSNYGSMPKTTLTTTMTTYTYPFVMPTNDGNARIVFNIGTYGNDITLDNVKLIELP